MRPNVLLLVLDAARRDAIEPYGAPAGSTPAIAALARGGCAVPRAYATSSWTLPSHVSIFSGLLPRTVGLGQAPDGSPQSAYPAMMAIAEDLLPEILRGAGYRTDGFSANLWASDLAGFGLGFDRFSYVAGGRDERMNALTAGGARARLAWAGQGLRGRADDGAAEVGRQLRSAIEDWSGTPTFWFVNLVECHSPYLPPRPWNDLGPVDRVQAALDAQRYLNFESICRHIAGAQRIPAESLERMRHLYGRAISYMDDWLAGILESLDRRGILEQTLVIVTSDHGENFDESGMIAHGFSLDQRLIHVPLVMAGPGATAGPELLSLAELPGVIAEAAGALDHPWVEPLIAPGIAVAEYDGIAAPDDPRIRAFAAKFDLDEAGVERLTADYTAATDGEHKLVVRNGAESLYDLRADPDERVALPAGAGSPAEALRAALPHRAVRAGTVGPTAAPPVVSKEELAAIEQQMKLLGYM